MSLSVGRVGSVGGTSAVSYAAPVSNAYRVDNQSEISDTYKVRQNEAVRSGSVEPVHPVQYATASTQTQKTGKAEGVEKAFNDIAQSFSGSASGYDAARGATNYAVVGSNFDMFA